MIEANKIEIQQMALKFLKEEAGKIRRLIETQMDSLSLPQFEELIDTQMFGLSKEIDFASRLDLISKEEAKQIILELEQSFERLND